MVLYIVQVSHMNILQCLKACIYISEIESDMWSLQTRSGPMLMLNPHMTINKKEWIIALGEICMFLCICDLRVGEYDLLSWFECRHAEIRTAGTAEGISQITLRDKQRKILVNWRVQQVESGWKSSRMNSTQCAWCHTYVPTGGFRLTGFRSGFALLLQLLREATRASPRHDHTQSVITAWRVMSNFKAHQQSFVCINWKLMKLSHQFLQAFFLVPASPHEDALSEAGSGFFRSSSSRRASESTKSYTETRVRPCKSTHHGVIKHKDHITPQCHPDGAESLKDEPFLLSVLASFLRSFLSLLHPSINYFFLWSLIPSFPSILFSVLLSLLLSVFPYFDPSFLLSFLRYFYPFIHSSNFALIPPFYRHTLLPCFLWSFLSFVLPSFHPSFLLSFL